MGKMTPVTLFSYITPEEQERMRVCFCMREVVYQNNETIMEYEIGRASCRERV